MSHRLRDLRYAVATTRPASMPIGRPRGAKAAGLRYERALAKALPEATHGQWWQYVDAGRGVGYCQTDLIVPGRDFHVVLEAKYTWTLDGHVQLEQLYLPIVSMALGRPAVGIVVSKKLTATMGRVRVATSLDEAMWTAWRGHRVCLQWLGDVATIERRAA